MTASKARLAAVEVLTRVRERRAYAHETLDAVLRRHDLPEREAATTTRLAYGAVAVRGTADEAIVRAAKPGTTLEGPVSDALALGAYEVLFAGTPSHAAVNETVEVVRALRPKAAGLANAVMRRLVDVAETFPWGDASEDVGALARAYGHPRWLAELWVDELGRVAAEQVMAADNGPAPMFLAPSPSTAGADLVALSTEAGLDVSPCGLARCVVALDPATARRSRLVRDRELLVVDAGAQFAVQALRPAGGQVIVDVGAGRGTKTLLMAALAEERGGAAAITAVDRHAFKLEALSDAARASGVAVTTVCADATAADSDLGVGAGVADRVLVDAPCSGLGTLRRHPDRRWRATPEEIATIARVGEALLARAARLVKPQGFVVYSTCTIAKRENRDVIEGFLASELGRSFEIDSLASDVCDEWSEFVDSDGLFQSLPRPEGPDGHFVARLVRR